MSLKVLGSKFKKKKSKNILAGCIYRHPHNNFKDFFQYFDETLNKLVKENKELYLCGDFNFDLLKTNADHFTLHFSTLLLWPHATHSPTN